MSQGSERGTTRYARLVMEAAFRSAGGFAIAVLAGASPTSAAVQLAWGGLLLGAGMAAVLLGSLALMRSDTRREQPNERQGLDALFNAILRSWRGDVFFLAVIVFAALEDPLFAAFLAGIPLGNAIIAKLLITAAAQLRPSLFEPVDDDFAR